MNNKKELDSLIDITGMIHKEANALAVAASVLKSMWMSFVIIEKKNHQEIMLQKAKYIKKEVEKVIDILFRRNHVCMNVWCDCGFLYNTEDCRGNCPVCGRDVEDDEEEWAEYGEED